MFVDNLNMPAPEEYGAQPPPRVVAALPRVRGFYDTKKIVWKVLIISLKLNHCWERDVAPW